MNFVNMSREFNSSLKFGILSENQFFELENQFLEIKEKENESCKK
jgi:hypothetical protein